MEIFTVKNKLATDLSTVLMRASLKNVSVEIQFLYYEDDNGLPVPGSRPQFLEKISHWAYEIFRVDELPLFAPVTRLAADVEKYCNKTTVSIHEHLLSMLH